MANSLLSYFKELNKRIEAARIKLHLKNVEQDLENSDPGLNKSSREKRSETLQYLDDYRSRGEFPVNEGFSVRKPYFVGPERTLCAVGYLLHRQGRDDLVKQVKEKDNQIYLEDLGEDELIDWESELGLTKSECERIQPSYAPNYAFAQTCGPVACNLALSAIFLASSALLFKLEKFTYNNIRGIYPEKPLKRRGTFAGFTVLNILLVANLFVLLFALLP